MKPHDQWTSADIADHARPGEGNDEMTDVPERIWAWNTANCEGDWTIAEGRGIPYIPESLAQAMLAKAREDALREAAAVVSSCTWGDYWRKDGENLAPIDLSDDILALIDRTVEGKACPTT